jgi:hypothetical protein
MLPLIRRSDHQQGETMKRADVNSMMPRARMLAIAAAAVAISACGGGGGGEFSALPMAPAPAAEQVQPPARAPDSSAPCINEADFREGTRLEFEALKPGADPATAFQRTSVTEGREVFADANPVAFNVGTETTSLPQINYRRSTVKKEYKDLVNGSMLLYGKATTDEFSMTPPPGTSAVPGVTYEGTSRVSETYTPPFSFPVDMKSGQVVSQQSTITKTKAVNGRIESTITLPAMAELTYQGREKLETPLGTFDACKFSLKMGVGVSVISLGATKEMWLAAEGPYRGQLLKGLDPKSPALVTKMTYTPS